VESVSEDTLLSLKEITVPRPSNNIKKKKITNMIIDNSSSSSDENDEVIYVKNKRKKKKVRTPQIIYISASEDSSSEDEDTVFDQYIASSPRQLETQRQHRAIAKTTVQPDPFDSIQFV
jgi:hypothetical protein